MSSTSFGARVHVGITAKGERVGALDGFRGLAILLVFLVHYNALFRFLLKGDARQWQISEFLISIGQSGVDIFFVISGFLIYAAVLKQSFRWSSFIRRRIRRIYPTFLVVFSAYLVLSIFFPAHSKLPSNPYSITWYVVENLLLLPGFFPIKPIISVSWSLSYELVFYVFIATLAALLELGTWHRRSRLWLIATGLTLFVAAYETGHGGCIRLVMFVAGMMLYEIISSRRAGIVFSSVGEAATLVFFVSALVLSGVAPSLGIRASLLFIGTLAVMTICLQPQGRIKQLFCWTPLRRWGEISYSYYLVHGLILWGLHLLLSPLLRSSIWFWVLLPGILLITLAGSAVLYVMVEQPLSLKVKANQIPVPDKQLTLQMVLPGLDFPSIRNSASQENRVASS